MFGTIRSFLRGRSSRQLHNAAHAYVSEPSVVVSPLLRRLCMFGTLLGTGSLLSYGIIDALYSLPVTAEHEAKQEQRRGLVQSVPYGNGHLLVRVVGTARPGVPRVVINGGTVSSVRKLQDALSTETQVISFTHKDLCPVSGPREAAASCDAVFEEDATQLAAVCNHLQLSEPIVLMSTDYNWPSSVQFAMRNRDSVRGLVLVDPMMGHADEEEQSAATKRVRRTPQNHWRDSDGNVLSDAAVPMYAMADGLLWTALKKLLGDDLRQTFAPSVDFLRRQEGKVDGVTAVDLRKERVYRYTVMGEAGEMTLLHCQPSMSRALAPTLVMATSHAPTAFQRFISRGFGSSTEVDQRVAVLTEQIRATEEYAHLPAEANQPIADGVFAATAGASSTEPVPEDTAVDMSVQLPSLHTGRKRWADELERLARPHAGAGSAVPVETLITKQERRAISSPVWNYVLHTYVAPSAVDLALREQLHEESSRRMSIWRSVLPHSTTAVPPAEHSELEPEPEAVKLAVARLLARVSE